MGISHYRNHNGDCLASRGDGQTGPPLIHLRPGADRKILMGTRVSVSNPGQLLFSGRLAIEHYAVVQCFSIRGVNFGTACSAGAGWMMRPSSYLGGD